MRLLLDTNIILDFFLERKPFFDDASKLFDAIAENRIEGFITASSVTDIFYIFRSQCDKAIAISSRDTKDREVIIHSGVAVPNSPITPNSIPNRPQNLNPLYASRLGCC